MAIDGEQKGNVLPAGQTTPEDRVYDVNKDQEKLKTSILTRPIILGDLTLGSPTTQTTVGAAGAASALPATPTGYLTINLGNGAVVVPYYAVS